MAIKQPLYLENLSYSATDDRRLITTLLPNQGIVSDSDLLVSQRASGGANRSVDVAAGSAIIEGTDVAEQGNYLFTSDAVVNVPLAAAPGSGQSRIDLIVAQILDQDANGGGSNLGEIVAVTGTAASTGSQVAPTAPPTCLVLAQVLVGPSVTTIVNANITDERGAPTGPATTSLAGHLASDVTLTSSVATILTMSGFTEGTWLVNVGLTIVGATNVIAVEYQAAAGTASATLEGQTAGECEPVTSGDDYPAPLTFIATITAPGTLIIKGQDIGSTGGHNKLAAETATNSLPQATGWTAIRV